MANSELFVVAPDLHHPFVHEPTWDCFLSFMEYHRPRGFVFLGDQFDNHSISHHTAGKPGQREKRAFFEEERSFERERLKVVEKLLSKGAQKVWFEGNHDAWTKDLDDAYPELQGCFDRPTNLRLRERGWTVRDLGQTWNYGKLYYAHGESLTGQYHARKAVDTWCRNLVYGHFHGPQSHTKVLPQDQTQKWTAQCLPILGKVNPEYLEGRPTAWTNGWGVVEYHEGGMFNLYSVVCTKGVASFGGKVFRG